MTPGESWKNVLQLLGFYLSHILEEIVVLSVEVYPMPKDWEGELSKDPRNGWIMTRFLFDRDKKNINKLVFDNFPKLKTQYSRLNDDTKHVDFVLCGLVHREQTPLDKLYPTDQYLVYKMLFMK
jgi:hypothetical protein